MFLEVVGSSAIFSFIIGAAAAFVCQHYLLQRESQSLLIDANKEISISECYERSSVNSNSHRKLRRRRDHHRANEVSVVDISPSKENNVVTKGKELYLRKDIYEASNNESFASVNRNLECDEKYYVKNVYVERNDGVVDKNVENNKILVKHTSGNNVYVNRNIENKILNVNSSNTKDDVHLVCNFCTTHEAHISRNEQNCIVRKFDRKCYQCMAQKITFETLSYKFKTSLTDTSANEHGTILNQQKLSKCANYKHVNGIETKSSKNAFLHNQLCELSSSNGDYVDLAAESSVSSKSYLLHKKTTNHFNPSLKDTLKEHQLNHASSSSYLLLDDKTVDQGKINGFCKPEVYCNNLNAKEKYNINVSDAHFFLPCTTIANEQLIDKKGNKLPTANQKNIHTEVVNRKRLYDEYKKQKAAYSDDSNYKKRSQVLHLNSFDHHSPSRSIIKEPIYLDSSPEYRLQNTSEKNPDNLENDQYQQLNASQGFAEQLFSNIRLRATDYKIKKFVPAKIKNFLVSLQEHINFSKYDVIYSSIKSSARCTETGIVNIGTEDSSVAETDSLENVNGSTEQELCKGCMDTQANVVSVPCGHCYLCRQCAEAIFKIYRKCYVCNINVISFEHVG